MFFAHTASCPNTTVFNRAFQTECRGTVNDTKLMSLIGEPGVKDRAVIHYPQFWLFFGALVLAWLGLAVIISVGDAICFSLLGDKPHLYGRQRMWGSAGWGLLSFLSGYLMDKGSKKGHKNYTAIFQILAVTMIPDLCVASCLQVTIYYYLVSFIFFFLMICFTFVM